MEKAQIKNEFSFLKHDFGEGFTEYIFNHVVISVDTVRVTGPYPEITWTTFDKDPSEASFSQPESPRDGVNMQYIAGCVKEVSRDSGVKTFCLFPYGSDSKDNEKREQARIRLFSKYLDIMPAPLGLGYLLVV